MFARVCTCVRVCVYVCKLMLVAWFVHLANYVSRLYGDAHLGRISMASASRVSFVNNVYYYMLARTIDACSLNLFVRVCAEPLTGYEKHCSVYLSAYPFESPTVRRVL